jgi:leucyl aminopeptidase
VRDLVNKPAGEMQPRTLVKEAQALAQSSSSISVTAWNRKQALAQGFTAFLAVAQGSVEEPYIIHLTYTPPTAAVKKVFVVGKGITFDSGGLNLKPTGYMEAMKLDMAGAAAVLGLFSVLPKLGLPIEVHGVLAACENMVSGSSYRPGDILRAKNGKTIEVLNTDAEGRIVLADALSFAAEHKPDVIIDLATLTGACVVALGETHAGLWSNDSVLSEALLSAARATGEGLAAMPMPSEYHQYLESRVADVRNVRGPTERIGDAIYAAFFLREFVGKNSWAHLDIAGPAYMEKDILPYYPLGGTGYGVRTLVEYLRRLE